MDYLSLIGRDANLFTKDISENRKKMQSIVANARFLIIGGAGSIGQAVTKELFKLDPKSLHVVDIRVTEPVISRHSLLIVAALSLKP